ncbi:MAG TPA: hypothetical protein PLP05_06640 [Sedimentisphaerales bacterium]|nr:hypothetical protein [Sedimentisphaerales bacterium]
MKRLASEKYLYSGDCRQHWGFTLVEAIAAIAIMSTSLLAIFGTAHSCLIASDMNRKLTHAVFIAETLINEQLLDEQIAYQTIQGQTDDYNWQIKILQTDIDNLAKIEITVAFKHQSAQQQYQLVSFLYIKPEILSK